MKTARYTVYELLIRAENGAYSNLSLSGALSQGNISSENKRLISRLFYGVIERKLTLDHIISSYSKIPAGRLDIEVLTVLRMGVYQLYFCDGIPESAAVNESVNIIKQTRKAGTAGFVNGVLRNMIRNGGRYELPKDKLSALSVKYSCGKDVLSVLLDSCGEENTASLLEASFLPSCITARVNTLKTDAASLIALLQENGINSSITALDLLDGGSIDINSPVSFDETDAFKNGLFHVQDISSQLCCLAADPRPDSTVIDVCAAPGGKSFTIAEMMKGSGRVLSCDLHKKRAGLIQKGAERLGLSNIIALCSDGRIYDPDLPEADLVLCDVPCSGLGVIKDKPEIKYKDISGFSQLPGIQYDILSNASGYVKSGGVLVYSTCTVNSAENSGVTDKFLSENRDFRCDENLPNLRIAQGSYTIYPKDYGSSGFYICRMIKK